MIHKVVMMILGRRWCRRHCHAKSNHDIYINVFLAHTWDAGETFLCEHMNQSWQDWPPPALLLLLLLLSLESKSFYRSMLLYPQSTYPFFWLDADVDGTNCEWWCCHLPHKAIDGDGSNKPNNLLDDDPTSKPSIDVVADGIPNGPKDKAAITVAAAEGTVVVVTSIFFTFKQERGREAGTKQRALVVAFFDLRWSTPRRQGDGVLLKCDCRLPRTDRGRSKRQTSPRRKFNWWGSRSLSSRFASPQQLFRT